MTSKQKWHSVNCVPGDTSSLCANQQPQLLGVTSALLALSTMLVGLRLISRGLSAISYWFDDLAIVIGLVSFFLQDRVSRRTLLKLVYTR